MGDRLYTPCVVYFFLVFFIFILFMFFKECMWHRNRRTVRQADQPQFLFQNYNAHLYMPAHFLEKTFFFFFLVNIPFTRVT